MWMQSAVCGVEEVLLPSGRSGTAGLLVPEAGLGREVEYGVELP